LESVGSSRDVSSQVFYSLPLLISLFSSSYKYCYPYGDSHDADAPIVARVANLLALGAGTISLSVVWWYLITGQVSLAIWKWSVRLAVAAGFLQLATLAFFASRVCRTNACAPGPAAYLALGTAVLWMVLGWELQYHTPYDEDVALAASTSSTSQKSVVVANLEMADLAVASHEYMERFSRQNGYQPPELA
jgi:hypothetical protein